jgi:hypothetical protein
MLILEREKESSMAKNNGERIRTKEQKERAHEHIIERESDSNIDTTMLERS